MAKLSADQLKQAYKDMLLLRRFQEKTAALYSQAHIGGFCHVYIGQEAVLTGCKYASHHADDYIQSYRCHAHALACGITPRQVLAELTGRAGGISKGKGGSMHMFLPQALPSNPEGYAPSAFNGNARGRFWGGHGIVTAQVPLGTGISFARKYERDVLEHQKDHLEATLCFMGDGAVNAGQFFESLNMAALWELPVLYIIENNVWGMGSHVKNVAAGELYKRGEPFGIRGEKVDGMDIHAVYEAVDRALDEVRQGKPVILEMDTYRYRGHSMSDPQKYRTRDDIDAVKGERDPIANVGKELVANHDVTEEELKAWDSEIKAVVKDAEEYALTSPEPDLSELWTDVIPQTEPVHG